MRNVAIGALVALTALFGAWQYGQGGGALVWAQASPTAGPSVVPTSSPPVVTRTPRPPVATPAPTVAATPTPIPSPCEAGQLIAYGFRPPASGGYGTFAFCGGSQERLLLATGCSQAPGFFEGIAIWHNLPDGSFLVWIPASEVAATNAAWFAHFPAAAPIPEGTIFVARCR